jgi:DNA-directed RNA polymerase specialized sigma24 family protein
MNQAGMSIDNVEVLNSKLRMYVELSDQIPLGDIQDAIEGVLDGISDNPDIPAELDDAVDDVLNSLTDPSGDPEQAVEDFMETFEGLDEEEQQVVYDALLDEFENSEYSLDDILGLIP